MSPHPFLEVEVLGEATVVRLTARVLDGETSRVVSEGLSRMVNERGWHNLCLDLGRVEFLTAATLGKFVALHGQLRARGGTLALSNVRPRIYEVFQVARLTEMVDIHQGRAKTVLVVEDHADTREVMKVFLEGEGYGVFCAADGQEALDSLRSAGRPSLILLDLMMDGMDGWQFRHEQRQDPALASIPVVVISAVDDALGGAARFLQKPVEFDHLLAAVREHC
jgi:anti-anti-sigma factor